MSRRLLILVAGIVVNLVAYAIEREPVSIAGAVLCGAMAAWSVGMARRPR